MSEPFIEKHAISTEISCRVPDVRDVCEVTYDGVCQFNQSEAQQSTIN